MSINKSLQRSASIRANCKSAFNDPYFALLAGLDAKTFAAVEPHLQTVALTQGQTIAETGSLIRHVYFPQSGIFSSTVSLIDGQVVQTGMIGWDGEFGAGPALDSKVAVNDVSVILEGKASIMDANAFRALAREMPPLQEMIIRSEQFYLSQVQQTVACNTHHQADQRASKLLLRMRQLGGDKISLTQEQLSLMLGVRRTTFSGLASGLQRTGAISYARGNITILDGEKLEKKTCECHQVVKAHHEQLFAKAASKILKEAHAELPHSARVNDSARFEQLKDPALSEPEQQ
jgi:CRP-like cAMP-binding protein